MRYLLDVNALIAYGLRPHGFHNRVSGWVLSKLQDNFLTCSITEIGFVRVLGNVRTYGLDVLQARGLLMDLKSRPILPLEFISDGNDLSLLPEWVSLSSHVTDGHLLQLARSNGAVLATLDRGIPESFQIP